MDVSLNHVKYITHTYHCNLNEYSGICASCTFFLLHHWYTYFWYILEVSQIISFKQICDM